MVSPRYFTALDSVTIRVDPVTLRTLYMSDTNNKVFQSFCIATPNAKMWVENIWNSQLHSGMFHVQQ